MLLMRFLLTLYRKNLYNKNKKQRKREREKEKQAFAKV